ncbi:MAG: urea ABC transporter substrate-binding protein [Cyanobacteria bacterium J06629_19]
MTRLSRRKFLGYGAATAGSSLLFPACAPDLTATDPPTSPNADAAAGESSAAAESEDIKVGLLHSLSGTLAISEAPLVEAELLAIEEINAAGGLLGRQIIPITEDGATDWPTFAEKAEKLITQNQVSALFGGMTTASRKAVLPVVTAKNSLLWYPGAYEGQECSNHIFYAGPTANQQIEPAINWMLGNRGKSFFLLSANDRTTHEIAKGLLRTKGGKVSGEAFVPLKNGGPIEMSSVVSDIQQALPEGGIIFNSLVGEQNRVFFQALSSAGLLADQYIVISLHVGEEEVFQIGQSFLQGHYAASSYFQTIESSENEAWVQVFRDRYGVERVINGAMENAYSMVHLWAQAVRQAESLTTEALRTAAYGQTYASPAGSITAESNHHVAQPMYIGKVRDDGLFDIVWESPSAIAPQPWSQHIDGSKGFVCDWSDPDKGEKYRAAGAEA